MDADTLYGLIGERIREQRKLAKLSQAKLADRLNMSRVSIVNIEAGRQRPPIHVLWEIAEVLSTELVLLLPNSIDMQNELAPVNLDTGTIDQIERAASGDAQSKRQLMNFISKAKSKYRVDS